MLLVRNLALVCSPTSKLRPSFMSLFLTHTLRDAFCCSMQELNQSPLLLRTKKRTREGNQYLGPRDFLLHCRCIKSLVQCCSLLP